MTGLELRIGAESASDSERIENCFGIALEFTNFLVRSGRHLHIAVPIAGPSNAFSLNPNRAARLERLDDLIEVPNGLLTCSCLWLTPLEPADKPAVESTLWSN